MQDVLKVRTCFQANDTCIVFGDFAMNNLEI